MTQAMFELYHTAQAAQQTLQQIADGTWKGDTLAVAKNLQKKLDAVNKEK